MMLIAVDAVGLTKEFRAPTGAAVRAVDRATLQIRPGQVLGLLGPAGAGKSTLLRLIGGDLKPTRGRVEVNLPPLLLDEPGPTTQIPPGQTALVATSDLTVALSLCQEIALMDRGRVLAPRSSREVRALCAEAPRQIRIRGHLPQRWAASLQGVTITNLPDGDALLEAKAMDQAALRGLLERLWDLGLPLVSVTNAVPNMDELLAAWDLAGYQKEKA